MFKSETITQQGDYTVLPEPSRASRSYKILLLRIQNTTGNDQLFILKVGGVRQQSVFTAAKATGLDKDLNWVLEPGASFTVNSSTADPYELTIEYL